MRKGIQCLAPTIRPTPEEIGWKITKVMKKNDTASLTSWGLAPIALEKPVQRSQYAYIPYEMAFLTLRLGIADISPVEAIEQIQQREKWKQEDIEFPVHCPAEPSLVRRGGIKAVREIIIVAGPSVVELHVTGVELFHVVTVGEVHSSKSLTLPEYTEGTTPERRYMTAFMLLSNAQTVLYVGCQASQDCSVRSPDLRSPAFRVRYPAATVPAQRFEYPREPRSLQG